MRAILDPTSETPRLVEGDRNVIDSMASDQDLSERLAHQLKGIVGEVLDEKEELRLYIKGKGIDQSKFRVLSVVIIRLRTSMRNRWE